MRRLSVSRYVVLQLFLLFFTQQVFTQETIEQVDTATIRQIYNEGFQRSQAMSTIETLTDVYGGRLTGSPEFAAAAGWAKQTFQEWGLENARIETWGPFGRGWSLKHFSAHMLSPKVVPLIGVPKAWSPGTDGEVKGQAVYLDVKTEADLQKYRGKLKGTFVLLSEIRPLAPNFTTPNATRHSDETMLRLANADPTPLRPRGNFGRDTAAARKAREEQHLLSAKLAFCKKEKALALIDCSRGDGGTVMSGPALVPQDDTTTYNHRMAAYNPKSPEVLPQVSLTAEHYNRIMRLLQKGMPVTLQMELEVEMSDEPQPGMNVLAEIPGTDLKDEVVMIGAHLDSWHPGSGAADNGTGVVTCMEAIRILKALDIKPRRTIRVALWGGEEQGLLGSRAYVNEYLAARSEDPHTAPGSFTRKPDYDKFCAYFNDDYGNGKMRGIYLQGNEALRPIFRAWLSPLLRELGVTTVTSASGGGTDHLTFDGVGLPGFQFIQDPIEYGRTYHTNMDTYERISEEDLKQTSVVMASFAYLAAMRDQKLPRKESQVLAQ